MSAAEPLVAEQIRAGATIDRVTIEEARSGLRRYFADWVAA